MNHLIKSNLFALKLAAVKKCLEDDNYIPTISQVPSSSEEVFVTMTVKISLKDMEKQSHETDKREGI